MSASQREFAIESDVTLKAALRDAGLRSLALPLWTLIAATFLFGPIALAMYVNLPAGYSATCILSVVGTLLIAYGVQLARERSHVRYWFRVDPDTRRTFRFDEIGVRLVAPSTELHIQWRAFSRFHRYARIWQLEVSDMITFQFVASDVTPELAEFISERMHCPAAKPKCNVCGYELRGLPQRRCPECGTQF